MNKKHYSSFLLLIFTFIFGLISFQITRLTLFTHNFLDIPTNFKTILNIFFRGGIYDLTTCLYLLIPFIIIEIFFLRFLYYKISNFIRLSECFLLIYFFLFNGLAEYFFWEEFGVRYNFIAVDYLIYSHEVIQNIVESYPLFKILISICIFSSLIMLMIYKIHKIEPFKNLKLNKKFKLISLISITYVFFLSFFFNTDFSSNKYVNELSKNGIISFFQAFKANKLDYIKFYLTLSKDEVIKRVRDNISPKGIQNSKVADNIIVREIKDTENEKNYNVVIVIIESLSAKYMSTIGDFPNLTPNLDELTKNSLFFTNMYATGTRTVRGLEAVTLSRPPCPGSSIIRQENNESLFSIGSVFKSRGYETKFIYSGFGYFDNMNYFFSKNGFKTIDRLNIKDNQITFKNAWGICDEDLYDMTLRECDTSFNKKEPFLTIALTTSNHRPYTYPEGKVNEKIGTRAGAVQYTDYSIGKFISLASKKEWFKNTIFAIVADHCANSSGKMDILPQNYHIPFIIYAPNIVKPQKYESVCSQIDIAPTIIGLCNFSYQSYFYGTDLLKYNPNIAFLSTYQNLALFKDNILTILKPNRKHSEYLYNNEDLFETKGDEETLADTISYYQSTWYLKNQKELKCF